MTQQKNSVIGRSTPRLLAGVESGVLGAIIMILWFALIAVWQQQHWYAIPNLLGSAFYGERALRPIFGAVTFAGIALQVILGGLAGLVFSLLVPPTQRPFRTLLLALLAGTAWYYFMETLFWRRVTPLVRVYVAESALLAAHVLFGLCLARIPRRALALTRQLWPSIDQSPKLLEAPQTSTAETPAPDSPDADTEVESPSGEAARESSSAASDEPSDHPR